MSKLNEQSKWEESINQVEDNDRVKGGESGAVNIQAGQLAARTQYLRNLFDSLMATINLGEGLYKTLSDAQRDIDNGKLPADALFNVRSTDDKHWMDEYQNINGLATPTGRFLASGNYLAEILTQLVSTMLTVGTLENRIKSIKSYHSDKYPIIFNAKGGPDETYGAFDNQSGLWLGGLEAAVQDYLLGILPKNKTNRYPGLAYFFAAENGDDSYGLIEKMARGVCRGWTMFYRSAWTACCRQKSPAAFRAGTHYWFQKTPTPGSSMACAPLTPG